MFLKLILVLNVAATVVQSRPTALYLLASHRHCCTLYRDFVLIKIFKLATDESSSLANLASMTCPICACEREGDTGQTNSTLYRSGHLPSKPVLRRVHVRVHA